MLQSSNELTVHRAWLATGCTSVAISLLKSITGSIASGLWLKSLFAAFIVYLMADLTSGVYHWAIDNYGRPETPVYGSIINTFQGRHRWPSSITYYEVVSGTYKIVGGVVFFLMGAPSEEPCPPSSGCIAGDGFSLPHRKHAKHYRPPDEVSYCTISGFCNDFLDNFGVFRGGGDDSLLYVVGARPHSWIKDSETSSLAIYPNHAQTGLTGSLKKLT